jgi:hypothetical protein
VSEQYIDAKGKTRNTHEASARDHSSSRLHQQATPNGKTRNTHDEKAKAITETAVLALTRV